MIKREDILPMGFLKKSDFSGSYKGLRYRLKIISETVTSDSGEERKEDHLLCETWPGPFNYHTTPDEVKMSNKFSFDEDGVCDSISWMNDVYAEDPGKWEKAAADWESYGA